MTPVLCLLVLLQEGVGFPGSVTRAQEEIRQGQGVVERPGRRLEAGSGVGIFNLDNPRCPHGLDCPPPRPAGRSVLVPGDATMGDKVRKPAQDVALNRSKVMCGAIRRLLTKLNPFHGKLRAREDE